MSEHKKESKTHTTTPRARPLRVRPYGAPCAGGAAAGGGVRVPDWDDRRLDEERTPCSALGDTSVGDALEGEEEDEGVAVSEVCDGDGDGDLVRGEPFVRAGASVPLWLLRVLLDDASRSRTSSFTDRCSAIHFSVSSLSAVSCTALVCASRVRSRTSMGPLS